VRHSAEAGLPQLRRTALLGRKVLFRVRALRGRRRSPQPRPVSPDAYTPKHLAEKILTSKSALEGERKRVTVLFADLKGSLELLADVIRRGG